MMMLMTTTTITIIVDMKVYGGLWAGESAEEVRESEGY
jgi:hypothetical protein